jgi:hypothetical protein
VSAGVARQSITEMLVTGNHGLPAPAPEKSQHRFHLRSHVAWRKVTSFLVFFHFGGGDAQQGPLSRLFIVEIDVICVSGDGKDINS